MKATVSNIATILQEVLVEKAEALARSSGFIVRQRALTGSSFAAGLVIGWLSDEQASLSGLQQMVRAGGSQLSRQGLAQRFTASAAAFMKGLLEYSLSKRVSGECQPHACLADFAHIYVIDSTLIKLPKQLREVWRGCQDSALKISLCWDLQNGEWVHCQVHHGEEHDAAVPFARAHVPAKTLYLADLGYYQLAYLQQLSADGADWIMRYKAGTVIYDQAGQRLDMLTYLQNLPQDQPHSCPVYLGAQAKLACSLVVQRATPDQQAAYEAKLREYEHAKQVEASSETWDLCAYTLYLTSLDPTHFPPQRVLALANLRWQIERLFCLWKTHLHMDDWRSHNPFRILCELYAKLIAALIQQWLFLLGDAHHLHLSRFQARTITRALAFTLLHLLYDTRALEAFLYHIPHLFHNCRLCSSRSRPSNLQQLSP
jgi:hypothetical protein